MDRKLLTVVVLGIMCGALLFPPLATFYSQSQLQNTIGLIFLNYLPDIDRLEELESYVETWTAIVNDFMENIVDLVANTTSEAQEIYAFLLDWYEDVQENLTSVYERMDLVEVMVNSIQTLVDELDGRVTALESLLDDFIEETENVLSSMGLDIEILNDFTRDFDIIITQVNSTTYKISRKGNTVYSDEYVLLGLYVEDNMRILFADGIFNLKGVNIYGHNVTIVGKNATLTNYEYQTAILTVGQSTQRQNNVVFENLVFYSTGNISSYLVGFHVTNGIIRNCIFNFSTDDPCVLLSSDSTVQNVTIANCIFQTSSNSTNTKLLYFYGMHNCTVIDNRFIGGGYSLVAGYQNIISRNYFVGQTSSCLLVQYAFHNIISENIFQSSVGGIRTGGSYNIITSNVFKNMTSFGVATYSSGSPVNFTTISNNQFVYSNGYGVKLYSIADYFLILGNQFIYCTTPISVDTSTHSVEHNMIYP